VPTRGPTVPRGSVNAPTSARAGSVWPM
jgi:hypothetical protein